MKNTKTKFKEVERAIEYTTDEYGTVFVNMDDMIALMQYVESGVHDIDELVKMMIEQRNKAITEEAL